MSEKRYHLHMKPKKSGDLVDMGKKFLRWMSANDYASGTIRMKAHHLKCFIKWCHAWSVIMPQEVTRSLVERYQVHLSTIHTVRNQPLSAAYRSNHLISLSIFFDWLVRNDGIMYSPISGFDLPKVPRRLPRYILTVEEVQQIIRQADVQEAGGIRDRAILETFYSTGIRCVELTRLTLHDLDFGKGMIRVRGKRNQERFVPIGERALDWIEKYIREIRPTLSSDESILFLTKYGKPFEPGGVTSLVCRYIKASNIGKKGACHIFRHTMATHMLENGADIRHIQAILGHASLNTTQIYTKVSIGKLKEIHTRTHPAKARPSEKK